jgi:cytochrome c oxidase subunit IV
MPFFILFAIVLLVSYMALRRELAPPRMIASMCVVGSVITITLFAYTARDTSVIYSIILGTIAGSVFSALTLTAAWFFNTSEARLEAERQEREAYLREQQSDQ